MEPPTQNPNLEKRRGPKISLIFLALVLIILASAFGGAIADRLFGIKPLDLLLGQKNRSSLVGKLNQTLVNEESVVIDVVEKVSPSVVTVAIETPRRRILEYDPFSGIRSRIKARPESI